MKETNIKRIFLFTLFLAISLNFLIPIDLQHNDKEITAGDLKTSATNIALNRPSSAESSGCADKGAISQANDGTKGVHDNGWRAACEHSTTWWKVELDGTYTINNVKIWFQVDSAMASFKLQLSSTGTFTGEEADIYSKTGNSDLILDITISSSAQGIYLRLYGTVQSGPNSEPFVQELEAYGTLQTSTVPDQPVLDTISPNPSTTGSIYLNWNDVSGATSYKVYRSTSQITSLSGATLITTTTSSSYTDAHSTDGTHYYTVVAVNDAGDSDFATPKSVVISLSSGSSSTSSLDTPVIFDITPSTSTDGVINLDWTDVTGADSYKVYRSTSQISSVSNADLVTTTTNSHYTDTLTTDGTYYYTIVALQGSTTSDMATPKSVIVHKEQSLEELAITIGIWASIFTIIGVIVGILVKILK